MRSFGDSDECSPNSDFLTNTRKSDQKCIFSAPRVLVMTPLQDERTIERYCCKCIHVMTHKNLNFCNARTTTTAVQLDSTPSSSPGECRKDVDSCPDYRGNDSVENYMSYTMTNVWSPLRRFKWSACTWRGKPIVPRVDPRVHVPLIWASTVVVERAERATAVFRLANWA